MKATGYQIRGSKRGTAARKGKERQMDRRESKGKKRKKERKKKGKKSLWELVTVKGEQSLAEGKEQLVKSGTCGGGIHTVYSNQRWGK